MAAKLEIEIDGETSTYYGWHAQIMYPLVRLAAWFNVTFRGGKLTVRRTKNG